MRRSLALLFPALLLAAACTQSPTAATKSPVMRRDGGLRYGSGNAVGTGGGNTLGSGNVTGGGATMVTDSATENERGTNYYGSGN